jgi:protein-S-isoprenylcysteine O-methyltransferase Ste14
MRPGPDRPASVTNSWINLAGLLVSAGVIGLMAGHHQPEVLCALAGVLALALTIGLLEAGLLRTWARASTGLLRGPSHPRSAGRIALKLLGLAGSLGLLGLVYWVAPEYRRARYDAFWDALLLTWPAVALAQVAYFTYLDGRMEEPRDAYWQLGCLLLGRRREVRRRVLGQHLLGWLVKGFFTPLMFVYLVEELCRADALTRSPELGFLGWFELLFCAAFVVDLLFATAGYLFSLRLCDSHLRSCDPTASGWVVTLVCYEPFWLFLWARYWPYRDEAVWSTWLADSVWLYPWGGLLLGLMAVYAWATLAFGLRFSNLTHRGILTSGPYRFTKHPAYLAKGALWWLLAMPFVARGGPGEALSQSLMLLAINALYLLRARTEERHLSRDPTYVAYALWMNEHGLLRGLARLVPWLRYRPPGAPME